MSSLAAASADNFYHPPEYDPRRHGGLSKFQGSRGANQYQKYGIIRFELPYNSWCLGCNRALGQGTRYNAKKVKAGNYFSTTIWEFHMKCAMCDHPFVIRTDPKNTDYEFVEGIRRIESEPTPENADTIVLLDDETKQRLETDPLFALENSELDKARAARQNKQLQELLGLNTRTQLDSFSMNRKLRRRARLERKAAAQLEKDGKTAGLPFALLPEDKDTIKDAKRLLETRIKTSKARRFIDNELGDGLPNIYKDPEDEIVVVKKKKRKKR